MGHPVLPSHVSTIGPPCAGAEQRDAWASLTPPLMADWVSPPPRKVRAREEVTESHAHPLAANWRSWEQHASDGSGRPPTSADARRTVAQSAEAKREAYDLNVPDREPQGPDWRPAPRREQVMESADGKGGGWGGGRMSTTHAQAQGDRLLPRSLGRGGLSDFCQGRPPRVGRKISAAHARADQVPPAARVARVLPLRAAQPHRLSSPRLLPTPPTLEAASRGV